MMFGFVGFHQRDSASTSTSTCWCGRYHRATSKLPTIVPSDPRILISMITIWTNGTD